MAKVINKCNKKETLLYGIIERYFKTIAKKYDVDINTLEISMEYGDLYINVRSGYAGREVKTLEIIDLKEILK